jgi:hypothetical protein
MTRATRSFAVGFLLVAALDAQAPNPDITGRWTGVADTTDEAGTKRQEKQTLEIRMEDTKLTGYRIDKSGKPGPKIDVQQAGAKVNVYFYPDFEGGEPLRRKLELKDGKLVGTFSAQQSERSDSAGLRPLATVVGSAKNAAIAASPYQIIPNSSV